MLGVTSTAHLWVLIAVVLLALAVIAAVIATIRTLSMTQATKIVWVLILALVPVLGLLLWGIVWLVESRRHTKDAQAA